MVFPVVMHSGESWTIKKTKGQTLSGLRTVVLGKTLETSLDSEEIKTVNLKGNQPWIFIGRTDAEAEAPIFWSPDANSWLTGKALDAGKDRGQKEKRVSEDEMAGWHHWCSGHELRPPLADGEGQGGLVCCRPWDHEELDTIGQLKTNLLLEVLMSVWEMIWMYEEAAVKTKWALKGHYGMGRKRVKCKLGRIPRKRQIKQNVHFRDRVKILNTKILPNIDVPFHC